LFHQQKTLRTPFPMLVTRQLDTEQSPWPIHKLQTIFQKTKTGSRMSNNYDAPLSTQPDWPGQYSFLPPGDSNIFAQSYDHVTASNGGADSQSQPRSADDTNPLDILPKTEPDSLTSPLAHRRSLDPLGLRQAKPPTPIQEQAGRQGDIYTQKSSDIGHDESLLSTDTPGMSLGSHPLSLLSVPGQGPEIPPTQPEGEDQLGVKEEEEEMMDDDEMVEGEVEAAAQPQTAAERTAQRRKMKRFR